MTRPDGTAVRLQVLGPLRLWRDGVELDAGPRQQAQLLACVLARGGPPVSTRELIDLIWGDDAPASALNIIQQVRRPLRRLLEPGGPRPVGRRPICTGGGERLRVQRRCRRARPGHLPAAPRRRAGRPHPAGPGRPRSATTARRSASGAARRATDSPYGPAALADPGRPRRRVPRRLRRRPTWPWRRTGRSG